MAYQRDFYTSSINYDQVFRIWQQGTTIQQHIIMRIIERFIIIFFAVSFILLFCLTKFFQF